MDLLTLINNLQRNGEFRQLALNKLAQFGTRNRRYLGAELLPEREVESNQYTESQIRYVTIAAPSGSRYGPAQKRDNGVLSGSLNVVLGNLDISSDFTSRDYDALIRYLATNRDQQATAQLVSWLDTTINRALIEAEELQRWEALINGSVVRRGDNGYEETITYPNPTGHRVTAGGTWSNDTYDPFEDIFNRVQFLRGKGYAVNRIITSTNVIAIMANNDKVKNRAGTVNVVNGQLQVNASSASIDAINGQLRSNGLPNLETYDLRTTLSDGTFQRFMPDNVMFFACLTGRDETIEVDANNQKIVSDTLGYMAFDYRTENMS